MISVFAAVMISLPWMSEAGEPDADAKLQPKFAVSSIAKAVREYVRQGDAALSGGPKAIAERQELSRRIAAEFASEPLTTWESPGNAAELMRFVLFGGSSEILKKALEAGSFPQPFARTAMGIVAFSERRLDVAREYLIESPGAVLPDQVEDPLALIKGTLLSASDADKAIAYFRRTELAAPGTALEEAAMRQHVMTLIRHGRVSTALDKLKVYVRRFPNSIYWRQFRTVAAKTLARSTGFDAADFSRLNGESFSAVSLRKLREFALEVCKQLVMVGSLESALLVIDSAMGKLDQSSDLRRSAELYRNLAAAIVADPRAAERGLRALDIKGFPEDEQSLVNAGIAMALNVQKGYRNPTPASSDGPAIPRHPPVDVQRVQPLPDQLNERAKGAMELAQKKLNEARP